MSTLAEIEDAEYKKSIMDWRNFAIVCDEDETNPQTVEVDLSNGAPVRAMYVSGRKAGADDSAAPNMFVMVGAGGMIKTSTDGINWTTRASGTTAYLWSIDYRNGLFIAGGDAGIVDISSNGVNWTVRSTGSSAAIEGVNYNDGLYFAFGNDGSIYYSYDTITWVMSDDGTTIGKMVNTIYTPNGYYGFANWRDGVYAMHSAVGIDWTKEFVENVSGNVIFTANRTVLIGTKSVCVGTRQSSPIVPFAVTSDDYGITNTMNIISSFSGKSFLDAAAGAGVIVAVGQSNLLAYSEDGGGTWSQGTYSDTVDYISVTYDGAHFYAVGYLTRKVAISSDGKNWAVYALVGVTANPDAVTYGTSSHSGNMYQTGVDALNAAAIVETLDGDVNADLAPVYGTDYNKGDLIDAVDPELGIVAAKRVLEVEHLIDKTTDLSITPKLGKDVMSLRQLIAKEIKNNGI
jgi:hypothetical protein